MKKQAFLTIFTIIGALVQLATPVFGGNIYINPSKSSSIKVYVTLKRLEAHLIVYRTQDRYEAKGKDHIWFYSDDRNNSTNISFVDNTLEADVIVCYTDSRLEAKWSKPNKHVGRFSD